MKLTNINNTETRKYIEFITDRNVPYSTERLYFCESECLDYDISLEGIKEASRNNELQILSVAFGNFAVAEIFLGSESDLCEYIATERKEELNSGSIAFDRDSTNLNITTLKAYTAYQFTFS